MSLALTIALPAGLLVVLASLGGAGAPTLSPTFLTPGIALFGFAMVMFTSAMLLARDRETALFARLLTAPLTAADFVVGYALPALFVAALQAVIAFAIGAIMGIDVEGNPLLVVLILASMAVFYVALGVAAGATLSVNATSGAYTAVLLLTIFGGTWFDLDEIGGPVETVAGYLPFAHAIEAMRAVLRDGAGFGDIATDLTWALAFSVASVAVAVAAVRRRMVE